MDNIQLVKILIYSTGCSTFWILIDAERDDRQRADPRWKHVYTSMRNWSSLPLK